MRSKGSARRGFTHLGLIGVEDFEVSQVKLLPIFGFWGGWGDFNVSRFRLGS